MTPRPREARQLDHGRREIEQGPSNAFSKFGSFLYCGSVVVGGGEIDIGVWHARTGVTARSIAFGRSWCVEGRNEIPYLRGLASRTSPTSDSVDALPAAMGASLEGRLSRPPAASWRPDELEALVDEHLKQLVGSR